MAKEFIRMQKLAGLITESQYKRKLIENQIDEGEIGGIDVDLVKSFRGNPYVKKISQQLKADPELLKNVVKFIADNAGDKTPLLEEEERYTPGVDNTKLPLKKKLSVITSIAGIGAVLGGLMGLMTAGPEFADPSMAAVVGALTMAVSSVGLGALGTDGRFDEDLEEDSIEGTIKQILDIGEKL
jgi:hypothetical protein